MIVLTLLRSESSMLKSFVGVRVAEIQVSWDPAAWRYVPTNLNPADDDLCRGIPVCEMNGRWMNGSSFLTEDSGQWPTETDQLRNARISRSTRSESEQTFACFPTGCNKFLHRSLQIF